MRPDEPVFPQEEDARFAMNGNVLGPGVVRGGLTKRELFAAMAMQGLAANSIPGSHHLPKECAGEAVQLADALIAELAKRNDQSTGQQGDGGDG